MPKITLKLSTRGSGVKKEEDVEKSTKTPKIKIKQPRRGKKKQAKKRARKVTSLPRIKLKTHKKRMPTIRVKPTMIPGDGYDSEDPEREDDPLMEDGIILRMLPDESLDTLRACVESGDMNGIAVKWKDRKRAVLKIHGAVYGGKLVNLPTVIEVHKSINKKSIYKTIDVCQMLLIVRKLDYEDEVNEIPVDSEYGETYPDGITPPMVRCKTRFGKRYEEQVIQNVEDEVDRLLKMDEQAETSTYEFIDSTMLDDPKVRLALSSGMERRLHRRKRKKKSKHLQVSAGGATQSTDNSVAGVTESTERQNEEDLDSELDKLIGEEESSEEEEDIGGLTKAKVEEDEGEQEEIVEGAPTETEGEGEDDDEEEEDEAANKTSEDDDEEEEEDEDEDDEEEDDDDETAGKTRAFAKSGEVDEIKQHNAIIMEEISELESTIEQKHKDLEKANNPIMRNRINDVISRLRQELDIKKSQIIDEKPEKENKEVDEKGKTFKEDQASKGDTNKMEVEDNGDEDRDDNGNDGEDSEGKKSDDEDLEGLF